MRSYQTAKLAVTTWTYGLARRWAGRGVTANLLDPGIVKGKSGSEHFEGPPLMRILMSRVIPFFVATGMQRGSQQYVRLAADPRQRRTRTAATGCSDGAGGGCRLDLVSCPAAGPA
jgi:NAD(P)-dependent dehydrogenase (short-subunit alcohol dehydrogenase family)